MDVKLIMLAGIGLVIAVFLIVQLGISMYVNRLRWRLSSEKFRTQKLQNSIDASIDYREQMREQLDELNSNPDSLLHEGLDVAWCERGIDNLSEHIEELRAQRRGHIRNEKVLEEKIDMWKRRTILSR